MRPSWRAWTSWPLTRRAAYANIVVPLQMLAYAEALDAAGRPPAWTRRRWTRPASVPTGGPGTRAGARRAAAGGGAARARPGLRSAADRPARSSTRVTWQPARLLLDGFLERFGHLSDSGNDFSVPPWREDPARVVTMALGACDVAEPAAAGNSLTLADVERQTPAPWRAAPAPALASGRRVPRLPRSRSSSTYTRGYGLFRGTFLAIGAGSCARGVLATAEDVFYLELPEVRAWLIEDAPDAGAARALVDERRAAIRRRPSSSCPTSSTATPSCRATATKWCARRSPGHPTSRGSARGPARIVKGTPGLRPRANGDVLVIPFSDVAWTPLFARAAGSRRGGRGHALALLDRRP